MRFAVIGAGGTGALLGASLQQAGHDVFFLARGTHLAAMKRDGLRIESERGNAHLQEVKATDKADEIGAVDAIMFCVKLWDVESAGEQIRPLVGSETCLIPMQNGIDGHAANLLAGTRPKQDPHGYIMTASGPSRAKPAIPPAGHPQAMVSHAQSPTSPGRAAQFPPRFTTLLALRPTLAAQLPARSVPDPRTRQPSPDTNFHSAR